MVKCSECGYLASRNRETRILEETEPTTRYDGLASKGYEAPICLVRAYDLWRECGIRDGIVPVGNTIVSQVCKKERGCKQWVKWQQGSTPKEHQEMMDREARLKWQAEREDADKKWRARQDWRLVIIAGIFTILGAILAAFLS